MSLPVRHSHDRLEQWRPLRDFEDLYLQVDQLMQSALGGSSDGRPWLPAADVTETDDAYVVEIELPGVRREDIDVEMDGNELTVSGELKERERKGLLRRRTRRVGEFEFRATLPGEVRSGGIEASLTNGVLTIRVPKAEGAKPNRIQITGE
jgi:HSP20 family protein